MAAKNMLDESYLTDAPGESEAPDAPETEGEGEPAEPAAAAPAKLTPITRRQKAKERDESILKELKETREALAKRDETQAERFARLERDNAELRGHIQGIASRPAPEARREEPAVDADKLLDEANALLDRKDFNGYQRKYAEYNRALVFADPRYKAAQAPAQSSQPAINPMLQIVASQYADVMSDPDALDWAQSFDRRLARQGMPESPQRWKQAFEEGRRILGSKATPKSPTYSTKSREVLSGVPTARNGSTSQSGSGERGVVLNDAERATARKFKMTETQYAQHLAAMHPERISAD